MNRYQQTILNQLRERGFSYGEAGIALNYAQTLLRAVGDIELNHLPIASGIEAKFTPDLLFLGSERIVEEMAQHPLPYTRWVSKDVWAKRSHSSEKDFVAEDCQYRVGRKPCDIYVLLETTYVARTLDPPCKDGWVTQAYVDRKSTNGDHLIRRMNPTPENLDYLYSKVKKRTAIVATGDLQEIVEKHTEFTGQPPVFIEEFPAI